MDVWNTHKSSGLYNIDNWGAGYFKINESGNVQVVPSRNPELGSVDLKELIDDLIERGSRTPILVRFPNIVQSRIQDLASVFTKAISEYQYTGAYRGVYPIKVNQQRFLVEEIVRYGAETHLGLEAGSKPELLVALALLDDPEALLICNGFKDEEYIETALLAQKLGRNILIVIDRYSEIGLVIEAARNLNIKPRIGFRAKLESRGSGKWVESSGINSKFGLSARELVSGLEYLEREGYLSSLELLHFHIGSQITALRSIKESLVEASRIYAELYHLGAKNLCFLDVGGGLGVDYDGSQTNWENSINYSLQEYANDVIYQVMNICDQKKVPHPSIITESGRALVAYHSVLVFDILGIHDPKCLDEPLEEDYQSHDLLKKIYQEYLDLGAKNFNESVQDVFKMRDDSTSLFSLGFLNLKQRALVEKIFQAYCTKAYKIAKSFKKRTAEMDSIEQFLRVSYYSNFSLFQSAPDTWAVDQLFPVMPIHRLSEEPTERGILLDLTCDSDGKVDKFIDVHDVKTSLELHTVKPGEPYYVGMFLLGAYQEILGDLHNLFGDTDSVHVSVSPTGYQIDHVVEGDSVNEVLGYLEYDRLSLLRRLRESAERALEKGHLTKSESRLLLRHYEEAIAGYTYLEKGGVESSLRPVESLRRIGREREIMVEQKLND
jgi:arginine decarboxylase